MCYVLIRQNDLHPKSSVYIRNKDIRFKDILIYLNINKYICLLIMKTIDKNY